MTASVEAEGKALQLCAGGLNVTGAIRASLGKGIPGYCIIFRRPCPGGCGKNASWVQRFDAEGRRVGRPHPLGHHCTNCHSSDHSACVECGRCVPKEPERWRWGRSATQYRADRFYCSNACRQKMYRRRAKGAKLADAGG